MNRMPELGQEGWVEQSQRVTHVSAIGEMALALTHLLFQPLDAIRRQIETADLLLKANPPDTEAVRAILSSLRYEHGRAADWACQLRDLLDKHALEARTLVVVNILEEVLQLVKADAIAHGSGSEIQVDPGLLKAELLEAFHRALARDHNGRVDDSRRHELQRRFNALTARERQVLAQVIRGRLNKQIAADLSLSERTVKHHRTHLTRKLQVGSAVELLRLSQEAHLEACLAETRPNVSA
jgi:DNA-binding CsgD family transcriptional regulator